MTQPMIPQDPNRRDYGGYIQEDEIDLRELFNTLINNKMVIILTSLFVMTLISIYLYLQPVSYSSYGVVEVKQKHSKNIPSQDVLFNGMVGLSSDEVDKIKELFKTYSINKKALELTPFDVQFFLFEDFKLNEIYKESKISIKDIQIEKKDALNRLYKISYLDKTSYNIKVYDSKLKLYLNWSSYDKNYKFDTKVSLDGLNFIVNTQGEKFKSYIVKLNGTKRDIYENIIDKNLDISRENQNSSLIRVSFRDTIPKRAKEYVDNLMRVFIEENIIEKSQENRNILVSIDAQLENLKRSLSSAESKIENFRVQENIIKPKEQSNALIKKLSKIDLDLTEARLKYELVSSIYYDIENSKRVSDISMSLAELGNGEISLLFDLLQKAQLKESELKVDFKSAFPELRKVRIKIKRLKTKIRSSIKSLKMTLEERITALDNAKKDIEITLKTLPKKEGVLENYNRKYSVSSSMYNYLLKLKAQKSIAQSAILPDLKVIDEAFIDNSSKQPKGMLIFVVGLLSSLILGSFLAFLKEFINNNIRGVELIENQTNIPILGFIPLFTGLERSLEVLKHRDSPFSESFREIRNNIRAICGGGSSNTILVTSTISGEGKTVTSVNLASIMSLANFKTVVINLDLRKPMLHKHFEIDNRYGVSSYLQEKGTIDQIIHSSGYENLDVIPSGPIVNNPSELLLSDKLYELLAILEKRYDYIIIDSAPIGLATDALALLNYVDMTIFIIRDGVSKRGYINNLNRVVKLNQVENLSIVVNGIQKGSYGYYSSYGYGYTAPYKEVKEIAN